MARRGGDGDRVLIRLGRALGTWAPGKKAQAAGPGGEGLGPVMAIWGEVVGEDVARNAFPLERSGDALVVLVSSSAWSNQLSLLGGHIVSALREAGIEGIERLRFRVGRSRRGQNPRPQAVVKPRPDAPSKVGGPSLTLDEAFERFREGVARSRDAKRARGWNQCGKCGAMLPEGNRCAPCAAAEASVRSARVQRLMFDAPWLGYRGTAEIVEGLTPDEYEANRAALLARWWEALGRARRTGKVDPGGYERRVAGSYLLLKTGWEPDRITPTIARNELTDEIHDLIYGNRDDQPT